MVGSKMYPVSSRKNKALPREMGYVDLASANYDCSTTGSITLVNTVPQGAGVSERIGKKWRLKTFEMSASCFNGSTATYNDCRIALVYDKRPTGSLPAITDIYDNVNGNSFRKEDNAGRFTIIKQWDVFLVGTSASGDKAPSYAKPFNPKVALGNRLVVNKSAGTGAIGDIEQGALYLVTMGGSATGTAAATLNGTIRVRFQDQ